MTDVLLSFRLWWFIFSRRLNIVKWATSQQQCDVVWCSLVKRVDEDASSSNILWLTQCVAISRYLITMMMNKLDTRSSKKQIPKVFFSLSILLNIQLNLFCRFVQSLPVYLKYKIVVTVPQYYIKRWKFPKRKFKIKDEDIATRMSHTGVKTPRIRRPMMWN